MAQGYVTAQDRMIQMDLSRHASAGTLAELLGDVSASLIDSDIQMRVHHFQSTCESAWQTLSSSLKPGPGEPTLTRRVTPTRRGR